MTTHHFDDQASSFGFQLLLLFLSVVTVVFISLGKEVGWGEGGKGRVLPYSSHSKISPFSLFVINANIVL